MHSRIPPTLARLAAACALVCLAAVAALAQSQATTGNIEGRVLDPQGAVVPGASVEAVNKETGLRREATADGEGNYRIVLLPPGLYTVRASATNFSGGQAADVQVTVGGKTPLDIPLSVSGASETITVDSETAPVVETTRTSIATTVNQVAIENLPVNGRNYLDFATLTPGVIRDETRAGDLSVGGQKGTLNNLQVDGADNNNTFFGQAFGRTGVRPPYQFSEESVQEFQVNQNGFSAEFGRAGGAVINVVTKSGTNEFHGGLFEYFRDESLNANTQTLKAQQSQRGQPNVRPPLQIHQFGGRVGGPIVRNRAFFFFTYDGQRQKLPNPVEPPNLFTATGAAARPLLEPLIGTYQINRDQDVFMAKGDIHVNQSNQLSLRFNQQNFTGVNNEFTGPLAVEEHSGDSLAKTTTFSGTLASTITSSVVNELRFQFARDKEPGTANSDRPEAQIQTGAGFLLIGRNNFSPRETTIKRAQIADNLSVIRGAHLFKTGFDFNFDRIFNFFPGFFTGQYTFTSYNNFAANAPSSYTQRFALPNTSGATTNPDSTDYAFFAQDDWRVTQRLTVNAGLRWDYQALAAPPIQNPDAALLSRGLDTSRQPRDRNNFAPRVGFSYAFDDKSVVRGGYGIFYGRTTAIMLGTAHSGNGIQTTGVTLTCTTNPATNPCPTFPANFSAIPTTGGTVARPDLFLFPEGYTQPYVQQARLGYERELFANTSFSATVMLYRGVHLSRTRDVNLGAPVPTNFTAAGGTVFTVERFPAARPLAGYNRISLFESNGNSFYRGLALQLQRRLSRGFQYIASYTFSKAEDDKPDQTAVVPGGGDDAKVVQNSLNIRDDYARADVDLPHRFVFSPIYTFGPYDSESALLRGLLSDWTVSGIFQAQSGFPYSAQIGTDVNRDGNSRNDRVPGTVRNDFRAPSFYQLDLRLQRAFRFGESVQLRLIGEGFNLTNRTNVLTTNINQFTANTTLLTLAPTTGGAAFGLPRAFYTQRQFQLAVKFDF